jgi:DNA-binding response OmpR family regulator
MSNQSNANPKNGTILVADDDANDVFFLRRAFKKAGYDFMVVDVPDGERAIQYLSGAEGFSDRSQFPLPSLLILDLKMPKMNGFEVLEWIKDQSRFVGMKVVVLSSSGLQSDKHKAETLGAHDYRVKPGDIGDMVTMVKDVACRWMT